MRLTVCDLAKNTCDSHHTPCAVRRLRHTACAVGWLRHTACAYYNANAEVTTAVAAYHARRYSNTSVPNFSNSWKLGPTRAQSQLVERPSS